MIFSMNGVNVMEIDYTEIGKRVRRRRKAQHLTQEQLAELCGLSTQYISHIETAVSIPSTETIMKLALALATTPDEFLTGTVKRGEEAWRDVAQMLRPLSPGQLELTRSFLRWVTEQRL